MIRVLLIPSSDYLGHPFPQRHNQIFERLHDGKNFEVHVVRFRLFDKPKLRTNLVIHELDGITRSLATYYLLNMFNHASEIRRIVRQESIDIIVLSNLAAPFVYTLMDKLSSMRVPVIFDLPDYYPTSAAGYIFDVRSTLCKLLTEAFDFILRYMIKHATVVTVASHGLVTYAKMAGAHNAVCVPNGIAESFLKLYDSKTVREKLGFSNEDIVVGYIGSIEFWLDMKSLIKGVAIAKKRGLPVKLLIIGRSLHTDYPKKVADWIKTEGMEKQTIWLDFVQHEEVPRYIAGLDVGTIPFDVLNPTAYYAAPNKMWEYFSQKKPVISTPIPEALSNIDCVLLASTPQDYSSQLNLITQRNCGVHKKIKKGYNKALTKTWRKSTEVFRSILATVYFMSGIQNKKGQLRNT